MGQQSIQKGKIIGIRVSFQENKLFETLAQGQGTTVSEFLRTAGLTLAEMEVDNKEVLKLIGKDRTGISNVLSLIESIKETLANSIKESNTLLSHKVDKVEKLVHAFLYAYFFHTPEVKESLKAEAKRAAVDRKKKVDALINDNKIATVIFNE